MSTLPAATLSHQRTTVHFPPGYGIDVLVFNERVGGVLTANVEKKGRGGPIKVASLPGPGELSDIVVRRWFVTERDAPLAKLMRPLQGLVRPVAIVREWLDASRNPHPQVRPDRWADCTFMRLAEPDHNDDASTTGVLELTFTPHEVAR